MARRPTLGGFSTNLFGGSGISADVFNIASQSRSNEAYLGLTRVEVEWEAGRVDNATYLAALATYVGTFKGDTSEGLNAQARLEATTYRIERNTLVAAVNAGTMDMSNLLAYDQSKLAGLNPGSQEYLDRLNVLYQTQGRVMNDEESDLVRQYQDGLMTTTQLLEWYTQRSADPRFAGNYELANQISDRILELKGRVTGEVDAKMVSDYSSGKITPTDFLTYAAAARSRYAEGTQDAIGWDQRIDQARTAAVEDDLTYRYSLSQDYLRLKQFVESNKPPTGGTSTSTSTRTILGADGKWKNVTSTSTKATAPSASEVAAWKKRQVEVDAAKRQMASITTKIGTLPGGFVPTTTMISYYQGQLGTVAKGTSEWYAIQGRIDNLNDALSSEQVLARQGVKLSFTSSGGTTSGGTSGKTTAASGGSTTLKAFMAAVAKVESGGRYDARNAKTGAYGKYQILPSNWSAYAQRAGLPADAEPTPENQERVALSAFTRYYQSYGGDWSKMAAAWHAGVAGTKGGPGTGNWGPATNRYVSNVLAIAGTAAPSPVRTSSGVPTPSGTKAATASTPKAPAGAKGAPALKIVTGVEYLRRGREPVVQTQNMGIPAGLDPTTFRKVYAAIETAFTSKEGAETATINLGNGNILNVFIGNDADERITLMRDLNRMNIDMAEVEAERYAGTASEGTKSAAVVTARREAAGHELVILGFGEKGQGGKTNPVTSAINILDNIKAGVAAETGRMVAAYERGDLTQAYLHAQKIQELTSGISPSGRPASGLERMTDYITEAQTRIAALTGATGQTRDQLLTGMSGAGAELKAELDRLANAADEIASAALPGEEVSAKLDSQLLKDGNGRVVFTQPGPRGQVVLGPGFVPVMGSDGKIDVKLAKDGIRADNTRGPMPPDKTVEVVLKTGSSTNTVYASYAIEKVGYVKMPDGSTVPLMGKVVTAPIDRDNNGIYEGVSTFFENPLTPGKWSSTPIVFKAPPGTSIVFDAGSTVPVFQFGIGNKQLASLRLDKETGAYVVWTESQGGLLSPGTPPAPLGTASQSPDAKTYLSWFERDKSMLTGDDRILADTKAPAIGFTPREWQVSQLVGRVYALKDLSVAIQEAQAGAQRELDPMRARLRASQPGAEAAAAADARLTDYGARLKALQPGSGPQTGIAAMAARLRASQPGVAEAARLADARQSDYGLRLTGLPPGLDLSKDLRPLNAKIGSLLGPLADPIRTVQPAAKKITPLPIKRAAPTVLPPRKTAAKTAAKKAAPTPQSGTRTLTKL